MVKRTLLLWFMLALLATVPVLAVDFHSIREDASATRGSSVNQQSSNQGFNLLDSFLDLNNGSFSLYWKGELQENGGTNAGDPTFGEVPPTARIKDNREQDTTYDWTTWPVVTKKALTTSGGMPPVRPAFTPNLPQAWPPVVADVDGTAQSPDHFLVSVGFEPSQPSGYTDSKEQVLNAYYPQMAKGLPGNGSAAVDRGTVHPFWIRDQDPFKPGMLIRSLAPLVGTQDTTKAGVGVVTQPLIFARVPATFFSSTSNSTISEVLPVIYLVVGTGEEDDFARVMCLSLRKPNAAATPADAHLWIPDPTVDTTTNIPASTDPPDGSYFNPTNGSGGALMWSYTIKSRVDSNKPTPVAGISFANIGDANDSRPCVYVTTADGQLICLNGKAADIQDSSVDGDPPIDPQTPVARWTWETPLVTSTDTGIQETPGFSYGMSPAVARTPLSQLFPGGAGKKDEGTLLNAQTNWNVSEWMLFVADTYGNFMSFEAPGAGVVVNNQLTGWNPLRRWTVEPPDPTDPTNTAKHSYRRDPPVGTVSPDSIKRERFIVPPLVYQGNTPLRNSFGNMVAGSSDIGIDDEVIFASEKGRLYCYDAIGRFQVLGRDPNPANGNAYFANDGRPTGTTDVRWVWPEDDTSISSTSFSGDEPRNWPRTLNDPNGTYSSDPVSMTMGHPIAQDDDFYLRGPLGVALGPDTNPDSPSPNLDPGDDVIFVPYMQRVSYVDQGPLFPRHTPVDGANSYFYEYVGSLKPYGFVQASRPIKQLTRATTVIGSKTVEIPLNRLKIGTVKSNGVPSTEIATILAPGPAGANPNLSVGSPPPDDTVYVATSSWYDENDDKYYTLPLSKPGAPIQITLEYNAPQASGSAVDAVTETLDYPSCYRRDIPDPSAPFDINNPNPVGTDRRTRASLGVAHNRLEERRREVRNGSGTIVRAALDEEPAEVNTALFRLTPTPDAAGNPLPDLGGWRQAAMFASGSVNGVGELLVPSLFRGRTIGFDHHLRFQRSVLGCYDPHIPVSGAGAPPYGPVGREFTYDPGEFAIDGTAVLDDFPACTDVAGGAVMVDGWLYLTYRNGHIRGYSNGGGGYGQTYNPPYYTPPQNSGNNGALVEAPRSIRILKGSTLGDYRDKDTADNDQLDRSVMFDWGELVNIEVDFGLASDLKQELNIDPNDDIIEIDAQVLRNAVQAQVRSSNGAIQPVPSLSPGVRPTVQTLNGAPHVVAVVPLFLGLASATNPLTPGTPLLWELPSARFSGELTYDIQVTQPGVQWRWPDHLDTWKSDNTNKPDRQHYWETERTQGAARFSGTAGPGNWNWTITSDARQWAPLISYNNPIMVYYDPLGTIDNYTNSTNGIAGLVKAIPGGSTTARGTPIGYTSGYYTDRNTPGRKNGDEYTVPTVDGAHSGTGVPVLPYIGTAVATGAGAAKQIIFGDHGKTTPLSTDVFPEAGIIRLADRSFSAAQSRPISLRVQAAPLTKMGKGADYGTRLGNGNPDPALQNDGAAVNYAMTPKGSFEQNYQYYDDSPGGLYSSIPQSRLLVTKVGTQQDLTTGPVQVTSLRDQAGQLPVSGNQAAMTAAIRQMEQIGVQVDIPKYQPDDLYSTRYRYTEAKGASPQSAFNPFFPGTIFGDAGQYLWDHAEQMARSGNTAAPPEDQPFPLANVVNPDHDDRLRRAVIYNDANNNGQLDLTPTYREAYRTFGVQVMVRPEMKVEVQQQLLDLGNNWHGKAQALTTQAGANQIRAYQEMQNLAASPGPGGAVNRSLAAFYQQYWRPFNLLNTGNVNLAYMKPEITYLLPGSPKQLIGLLGEGLDAWRALPFANNSTAATLADPYQIFLRTSFDDQLLPDLSAPYGASNRGVWLQKAAAGGAQPGSVIYTEDAGTPTGQALPRDPSYTGKARDTWLSLHIPTGTAMGQYIGSLRFYNDRAVAIQEAQTLAQFTGSPAGYAYARPGNNKLADGNLDRDATGEPLEPVTDPPLQLKVKVTENMIQGRGANATAANNTPDADRRVMPAAAPSTTNVSGNVASFMLAYGSNRNALGAPFQRDVFGTILNFLPAKNLFPFDELPLDRPPWLDFSGGAFGWTPFSAVGSTGMVSKPSLTQDPTGLTVLSWVERVASPQGGSSYQIRYESVTPSQAGPFTMKPGNQPMDGSISRERVRMLGANVVDSAGTALGRIWTAVYSMGTGLRRNIGFSTNADPAQEGGWSPEHTLATSKSLSVVQDPYAIITDRLGRVPGPLGQTGLPGYLQPEDSVLPQMMWLAHGGTSARLGRTDIYLGRYRTAALATAAVRGTTDPQSGQQDYAQVGFPRMEHDTLKANSDRTVYTAGGCDWIVAPYSTVQVYLARPDIPAGTPGSLTNPVKLINDSEVALTSSNDELLFPFATGLRSLAPSLANGRVMVDKSAGLVRIPMDVRTLARLVLPTPTLTTQSPDPVLMADYTPATLRVSRGDISASDPVIVPVMSQGGVGVYDASWYRQQLNPAAWNAGIPVPGQADRLWVLWRRASGTTAGGPTCFYKVYRPGVRVNTGQIYGIQSSELQVQVGGNNTVAEEVNPQTGQIFFPASFEGQRVNVTYRVPANGGGYAAVTESHVVTWQDETGERALPTETSVNEGSLDAFASYEDAQMSTGSVRRMERIWLFWGSTRGTGGDLFWGSLAPRIGPEANVGGSITIRASSAASLQGMSANAARNLLQQVAAYQRRRPITVPPVTRRGPYFPRAAAARPTTPASAR